MRFLQFLDYYVRKICKMLSHLASVCIILVFWPNQKSTAVSDRHDNRWPPSVAVITTVDDNPPSVAVMTVILTVVDDRHDCSNDGRQKYPPAY